MSHRDSRGRGASNVPAWMSREIEKTHMDDRGGGRGGGHHRDRDYNRRPPPRRYDRRYDRDYDNRRSRGGGSGGRSRRASSDRSGIHFQSYEEERAWVEERRRRRHERKSLFDVMPTSEQLALEELQKAALASSGPNPNVFLRPEEIKGRQMATDTCTVAEKYGTNIDISTLNPNQTRHARRLYVGNLPEDLTEEDVHKFFRSSIHTAMGEEEETAEDHIISVYINKERRFAFIEFHSIDVCTACLALDGIDVCDKGTVKVKRPNDYNPAMVPPPDQEIIRKFDASKLGIISATVPDSPNKIFVGGLPYHLNETQVLELLRAFGEVKAFHLVKADALATSSKGYCFVEYADENAKDIAIMGLNGMDMGNGKQLSAKIATTTTATTNSGTNSSSTLGMTQILDSSAPPIMKVVDGVDIEALVDIAMGKGVNSALAPVGNASSGGQKGVLDIANAALAAAYGQ